MTSRLRAASFRLFLSGGAVLTVPLLYEVTRGAPWRRCEQIGAFFPQPPVLPHQEPQRDQARCHVVVPSLPGPHLVVVEAGLALPRTPPRCGFRSMVNARIGAS
jgi:hypothetical protein